MDPWKSGATVRLTFVSLSSAKWLVNVSIESMTFDILTFGLSKDVYRLLLIRSKMR